MLIEDRHLSKNAWGQHLWSRGYVAALSANVTDDVIMQCIEMQDIVERARGDAFDFSLTRLQSATVFNLSASADSALTLTRPIEEETKNENCRDFRKICNPN